MFAHRYFAARCFAPRYFPPAAEGGPGPEPDALPGPAWREGGQARTWIAGADGRTWREGGQARTWSKP